MTERAMGQIFARNEEVATARELDREFQQRLEQALREIRHGSVTLVIQDGRVIQIDKSEKIRLK